MTTTSPHPVASREEWLAARLELLEAEKEHTRRADELARRRQALPWVPVEKDYVFATEDGPASLADLFRGRSQLLVYHFMFPPSWSEGCASCSSSADGFDGFWLHLEHHDVAFTVVSRAPLEKLLAYKRRMGWSFPWVSSAGSDFNADFGVSFRERDLATGAASYNYRPLAVPAEVAGGLDPTSDAYVDDAELPGMSAFARRGDPVFHTYSAYARGLDVLWGMYQWLDRAPAGRNDGEGMWFRRRDEYPPG